MVKKLKSLALFDSNELSDEKYNGDGRKFKFQKLKSVNRPSVAWR